MIIQGSLEKFFIAKGDELVDFRFKNSSTRSCDKVKLSIGCSSCKDFRDLNRFQIEGDIGGGEGERLLPPMELGTELLRDRVNFVGDAKVAMAVLKEILFLYSFHLLEYQMRPICSR